MRTLRKIWNAAVGLARGAAATFAVLTDPDTLNDWPQADT